MKGTSGRGGNGSAILLCAITVFLSTQSKAHFFMKGFTSNYHLGFVTCITLKDNWIFKFKDNRLK